MAVSPEDPFSSPEIMGKFAPLPPELVMQTMYVYVNSSKEAGRTAVDAFDPIALDQVIVEGQAQLGFSDTDREILQAYLSGLLSNDHYRTHVFYAMMPKAETSN